MEVSNLLEACYSLKDSLIASTQHQTLLKNQETMLKDEYVQLLIQYFQTAQSFYSDAIRFQVKSKDELSQKLSQAKDLLYTHPLVKIYLQSLDEFNHLLDQVAHHIFGSLKHDNQRLSVQYRQSKFAQVE